MKETESLVKEVLGGNMHAFEELYHLTSKQVYFTCFSFVKNEQDAMDIMQETYLSAMTHLSSLKEPERFPQWISQIATNKCRNHFAKKTPVLLDEEVMNNIPVDEEELTLPEKYIIDKAKRKILMDIMSEKLSMAQYQTVILYYFDGLSQQEIAECMNCPEGTVFSRLSIARNKIKDGVLAYEKKSGEKLYCVAGIPFLTAFFVAQAEGLVVPNVLAGILSAFTAGGSVATKAASGAVAKNITESATSKTAKEVAKKTGLSAIVHSLFFKISVGIALLACIGAGVVAVMINSKPKIEYVYESETMTVEYVSSVYAPSTDELNGNIQLVLNFNNKTNSPLRVADSYFCANRLSSYEVSNIRSIEPGEQEITLELPLFELKDEGRVEISATDILIAFYEGESGSTYGEKAYFTVNFAEPLCFDSVPYYPYDECQLVYSDEYVSYYSTLVYRDGEDSEFGYIESNMTEHANFIYSEDMGIRYSFFSMFPDSYTPVEMGGMSYYEYPDKLEIDGKFAILDFLNGLDFNGKHIANTEYFHYEINKIEE